MPIYEYRCNQCGHVMEYIHDKFDGGPQLIKCEQCKGPASKILSRVIHKNKRKGRA